MKRTQKISWALALAALVGFADFASAQTTVTTTPSGGVITSSDTPVVSTGATGVVTTTTRVGRVGTVTPDELVMESASGTEPVPYVRTRRTVFVDDAGAVVPAETVRAGVPVTVHYSTNSDHFVADRVVVHRREVTPAADTVITRPSTTVERPRTVIEERPAVVERSATVVEKPARKPLIKKESKTTTTTTTTAPLKKREVEVEVDDDDDDDDDD